MWLTGSIYGAQWQHVSALAGWLLLGAPFLVGLARHVNVHELDDALASGVGQSVGRMRLALLTLSVALAGAAIAYAGAMAFVGLLAPHIAKKLASRSFPGLGAGIGADGRITGDGGRFDWAHGVLTAGSACRYFYLRAWDAFLYLFTASATLLRSQDYARECVANTYPPN